MHVPMPQGTITLDEHALLSVASQATTGELHFTLLLLEAIDIATLSEAQQHAIPFDSHIYKITLSHDGGYIRSFGEGVLTISVPYTGLLPVTVWYLCDEGTLHIIDSNYCEESAAVTFSTQHLSLYIIGHDYQSTALITRAEAVYLLWQAVGAPDASNYPQIFTDVDENSIYAPALRWAAAYGYIVGIGNAQFAPDTYITLRHMTALLTRYHRNKKSPPQNDDNPHRHITYAEAFIMVKKLND
jgi:hypothetical protein